MNIGKKLIIAVDGYSSCGKSTFAKAIAQKLDYIYIDTGAMYRAVTLFTLNANFISDNNIDKSAIIANLDKVKVFFKKSEVTGKNETFLNGISVENEIRGLKVSNFVSQVSAIKEVRQKMVELQRKMSEEKGVILDGRDIGTVVFPNADIKLFMTADPKIRAQRRYDELIAKGEKVNYTDILQNVIDRDHQDTTRAESPLKRASDAIELDNSYMSPEEQMDWFINLLSTKYLN